MKNVITKMGIIMIIVAIIKQTGDHTHQNVREERNRCLSFYHNQISVMSVSKKTPSHYRKTNKCRVSLCHKKVVIKITQPSNPNPQTLILQIK